MTRTFRALLGLCVLPVLAAAIEPWSDDRLPIKDGLELWFDCSRQNAARAASQLPPLGSGNSVDYLLDSSGLSRDLAQHRPEARPRFQQAFGGAFLAFDGKDDALLSSHLNAEKTNVTVFVVAAPRSNEGSFRGFFGLSRAGRNDYLTGLNFDFGPWATPQVSFLNVESSGVNGAAQLLAGPGFAFGGWHTFTVECEAAAQGVRLFIDGKAQGARDRQISAIRLNEFVLGARHYSNTGEPPHTQGFFHGNISEFILYSRRLSETERTSVERYLNQKYGSLLGRPPELLSGGKQLLTVTNPPPVQMLQPGFAAREVPVSLRNINNVKYRADGKLVALGYDGNLFLLSDTDGDGLEDKADPFWTNNTIRAPIGLALTPPGYARGQGAFVAGKGKVSLVVDTNGDDRADQEIIVADGWKELPHGVDALGVAMDGAGNLFFGLGVASFTEAYLVDKATDVSRYDLKSERGTILKVSPDFQRREIVCTGIRFPVALAFNQAGDLFCTDQEGATWLPNGNPLDELLHIQPGRHYGFPPRHPKYLPGVIDEPSVFDYAPQHQSTCGLNFNVPVNRGPVFGPDRWEGDALVCGYSRGKIWRTKLARTPAGYVAQNQLIASLPVLSVDACVSPQGDLLVAAQSGEPDWGSGPNGPGRLYKISYVAKDIPQPVLSWSSSPSEIRIAFDRPLNPITLKDLARRVEITQGPHVTAGDRFEVKRPGYAVVHSQLGAPRYEVPVLSAGFTADGRTLVLNTRPLEAAGNYGVMIAGFEAPALSGRGYLPQQSEIDLVTDLRGVATRWEPNRTAQSGGSPSPVEWENWLPHIDLEVARSFVRGSAEHDALWPRLQQPGTLTLRGQLDLWEMLQPAVQPGSNLNYERPVEDITVVFTAAVPFTIKAAGAVISSKVSANGGQQTAFTHRNKSEDWLPFEVSLPTGESEPLLSATWFTADDPRPRAFPTRRFLLPWAKRTSEPTLPEAARPLPELAGGNWMSGKRIYFGDTVACHKCHVIGGEGSPVGPDLSNLVHRDYASVLKDIRDPNAALNPDHLSFNVQLTDGEELTAVLKTDTRDQITVADASGRTTALPKSRVKSIQATALSLMPEGLEKALSPGELKDLMTFLMAPPLAPAPLEIKGEPPPRRRAELEAVLKSINAPPAERPASPFHIVLCAGPKDHGPGEHDYPLWQKRWATLLALAENTTVGTAWEWPSAEQWRNAGVVVFYSNNPGWSLKRAGELDTFLARGGGVLFIHFAVDGHKDVEALAQRIGLAWRGGFSKFRHGQLDLKLERNPITAGLNSASFVDESYWNLVGDVKDSQVIASAVEEGEARPLIWTRTQGKGRVLVSIPGHYNWTFDDPLFRLLLLRGICWAGAQPLDRLTELAGIGARLAD